MPLIKSLDLPGGMGQHFFFDAGNGDCVAFFWFADAPDRVPGISSPEAIPGIGEIVSAVSTMNHLAFHVPAEKFDEYRQRLKDKGVRVGPVLNHDESEAQVSPTVHPGVYVRSFYFHDPDGITLEFACWTKEFTEDDTRRRRRPRRTADRRVPAGRSAAMRDGVVSDAQIAAMSAAERRELITRLERPIGELVTESGFVRMRRVRLVLMAGAIVGLIPWIVYLSITLPDRYIANNWTATWVGFDILLLLFMASTAVLGLLRRQLLILTAFTTGVLLVCDAWFDVMTAAPADRWLSVLTAILGELPLAAVLITGALRILRLTASRLYVLDPGMPLWRIPLLP